MTGIEKIIADLAWRGPNGKVMGHVVLTRAQAEEILAEARRLQRLLETATQMAGGVPSMPPPSG